MSDLEDDDVMEVDGGKPAEDDSMVFHALSADKKGKRSAVDLPVELEDSLPWVEKYRPTTFEEVAGHQDILATINKFVDANRLPHLLLYGPPGTGKTSTVLALARKIYGTRNMRQMVLELNASDDRGIDVVREQIKTFSSTKQIFNSFAPISTSTPSTSTTAQPKTHPLATFKLIILDEADAMTSAAQMALRRIMEKYTPNTRFCIIANYTHKLSPALLSRCTRFRFSPLPHAAIRQIVEMVVRKEDVRIEEDAVEALVRLSRGDMRRALNVLQACHASTLPMPEAGRAPTRRNMNGNGNGTSESDSHGNGNGNGDGDGDDPSNTTTAPAPDSNSNSNPDSSSDSATTITPTTIYTCIASPHPSDIGLIQSTLLSTSDISSCLSTLTQLQASRGLALADVISALAEELAQLEVPRQTRVRWLEGLAEVEYRLAGGGSEKLQAGGLVGVVREGVELMGRSGG